MIVVETERLSARYGSHPALNGITLQVPAGAVCGVIGPNGSGKTTLLKVLATLLVPSGGRAELLGHDVIREAGQVRRGVGYVPDGFGLYPATTVWEYLDFFAQCWGIPARGRRALITDLLNVVDLHAKRAAEVTSLSKGARQRLALARALVHDPAVLLLDEPLATLDPRGKLEMVAILRELASIGKTVLITSNLLAELGDLCNLIMVLEAGRALVRGEPAAVARQLELEPRLIVDVLADVERAEVVLGRQPGVSDLMVEDLRLTFFYQGAAEGMAGLLRVLVEAGVPVASFRRASSDIQDLFVELTQGSVT